MTDEYIKKSYDLLTYKLVWERMKKQYNLSDAELRKEVQDGLQMWAWSDIMEGVEAHLKEQGE